MNLGLFLIKKPFQLGKDEKWKLSRIQLTLHSVITHFDAFEILCIWK